MNKGTELNELLATLEQTHLLLRELTGDEIDAVVLPSGAAYLLNHAQNELQEKTALLSAVLNALPANIALLDREGVILSVNRAWIRFGQNNQAHGDQVGDNYLEVCRQDPEAERALNGLQSLLRKETEEVFEMVYPCHSPSKKRWFRLLAAPTVEGAVVMHLDISASWRAIDALQRSQQRYQELFDLNPRPMWVLDIESQRFVDVNRAATTQYGYTREEFLTLTPDDIQVPTGSLEQGKGEYEKHRRKDGSIILVESYQQILEPAGKNQRLVLAIDVSRRVRAQRALHESKAVLAMASKLSRLGAWRVDMVTQEVQYSEEYLRIFAPSMSPTAGFDEVYDTVSQQDRATLTEMFDRCLRDGIPFEREFRLQPPDGNSTWARVFGEAVRDSEGKVVEIRGATQDITPYHQALEELRASEERFRTLAQATDDVIWDWDLVTDEHWWNANLEVVFGHRKEDLEPGHESWTSRIHPQDLARVWIGIELFLENDRSTYWSDEYRFRRGDGTYARVADRGTLIRDQKGHPIRMVGGMTDITERRQSEKRLAAQASLIDQATDAIIVHTLEGKILFWSRGAERLYGWSAADAEGRSLSELLTTEGATSVQRNADFLSQGAWSGELEERNRQGQSLTVLARWTLLRDAFDQSESVLAIHTDISERKNLQELLRRSQRLESIGTLAGGIAHDLNNVLSPIVMAMELLEGEVESSSGRGLLDMLRSSSRRASDLVKQILTFTRGIEGVRRAFDVLELVSELEQLMRETFPRNLVISVVTQQEKMWVQGDPTQLHQVLLNLCVNARDAMPEGGKLTVTLSQVTLNEAHAVFNPRFVAGPHARINVADTGGGIPLEIQDKVMEPFFTTKDTGQGTGLGLFTAFAIVRDHGGLLTYTSEPGEGTVFQLDLPMVAAPAPESPAESPQLVPRGKDEVVLLVDDEASIRSLARRILERHGYGVLLAADGVDALTVYSANAGNIAAVITDMSMPTMDGPTLVRTLRSLDPRLPIIGCSGQGYSARIKELGLEAYLDKPYEYQVLVGTLRTVLDDARHIADSPSVANTSFDPQAKTILVVDDDKVLLQLMSRVLRGEGHQVLTSGDAKGALELIAEQPVNCLLTDVHLPGMSGRELKSLVQDKYPQTSVVLVSGSAGEPGMLAKPFTLEELKTLVRHTLDEQPSVGAG